MAREAREARELRPGEIYARLMVMRDHALELLAAEKNETVRLCLEVYLADLEDELQAASRSEAAWALYTAMAARLGR